MSRYEFIETLRSVLNRSLTPSQVTDHVNYYEEYIRNRVAAGENERAVLASLGDPRLIARTILETWQSKDTDLEYHGEVQQETYEEDGSRSFHQDDSRGFRQDDGSFFGMNGKVYRLDKWYLKLIPIALILLVLGFVFTLFFGMMKLAIMILTSPFFWGVILVITVLGWFSRRR